MMCIFLITTLSAVLIGITIYLFWPKKELLSDGTTKFKPDKNYPKYHDYNIPSKADFRVPQWMRDQNMSQGFFKGDIVINLQKEYPYNPYGEIYEVTDPQHGSVYLSVKFLSGEYKGKQTQLSKYTVVKAIKKQETIEIKFKDHNTCLKEVKEGATVIAEYFMCYQRIIIEGELLGYNQFGSPVIKTHEHIIVVAKNILKEISKKRKK